ncbi:ABC transporter permease [Dactylosporangium sp. NPDC050588]|uniref:ABC transporter permease n=1 Tax=Dactylosporangium sp. NPDC050588 TaxID=3157211 RepID=UPI0033D991DE
MTYVRVIGLAWWLQLKMRSRSAFDGLLGVLYPLFFSTVVFMMFRHGDASGAALLSAAVGASVMGVWSSTSTTASAALQQERRQGTLELLVAAPTPLPVVILPITLSMATIGAYSLVVTLVWGRFAFGVDLAIQRPVQFVLAATVTVVSIGVLGFLLAVSSVRYRTAWALGTALEMPVWLISGFLVPLDLLPAWIRPISWLLAPTWGIDAIRAAAEGRDALPALAACLGLAAVYGVVGSLLAVRLVDAARRHATLALT